MIMGTPLIFGNKARFRKAYLGLAESCYFGERFSSFINSIRRFYYLD